MPNVLAGKILVDTNVLLEFPQIFNEFDGEIVIHSIVCEELDNIIHSPKHNDETKYQARMARNAIKDSSNKTFCLRYPSFGLPLGWDTDKNDNKLLAVCMDLKYVLCTNDLAMQIKADSLGIEWIGWGTSDNDIYNGYKRLSGDTDFINNLFTDIESGINKYGFVVNEYLILENTDLKNTIEYRFDGEKFVDLKLPPSKIIKGLNSEQRCVLDLLHNKDIGIRAILGTYGSGKTYLALRMALYHTQEKETYNKILAVREPNSEGKEIGYIKGDFDQKTEPFFKPIQQCLKGGEQEMVSLLMMGVLEKNIPRFLKGTTYDSTVIIVDEAEDLSESQLKMIGTRLGKDSAIAFCGDYKQAIRNANVNNPLVKMCKELKGDPKFGCIVLPEDVRSDLSKIFAGLFEKKK